MKNIIGFTLSIIALLSLYACNNDISRVFDPETPFVEFNSAVTTANSVGRNYPVISVTNSVTAGNTVTTQLNLVGRQRSSDLPVRVLVDPATTAPASSYTLSNGGVVTFVASSPTASTATMTIAVARATSTTAPVGNLVLVLDSTSTDFKPSQNYKRIGFSFRN